jgi:hypothetical protein
MATASRAARSAARTFLLFGIPAFLWLRWRRHRGEVETREAPPDEVEPARRLVPVGLGM